MDDGLSGGKRGWLSVKLGGMQMSTGWLPHAWSWRRTEDRKLLSDACEALHLLIASAIILFLICLGFDHRVSPCVDVPLGGSIPLLYDALMLKCLFALELHNCL